MLQPFIIVLREAFEAFLIVAIIFAFLKRTGQTGLLPAVIWGIGVSIVASAGLGYFLWQGANEPLWEAIFGFVAVFFVTTLVIQMWREGKYMKAHMEQKLSTLSAKSNAQAAWWGMFLFTVVMISREGMETALMLMQVPHQHIFAGAALGVLATAVFCLLWVKFSSLINLRVFFQVTGIFLLLFVVQILIYSFHELSETGLIPNAEAFHNATEPYSPDGLYGKWFSPVMVAVCAFWLVFSWFRSKALDSKRQAR